MSNIENININSIDTLITPNELKQKIPSDPNRSVCVKYKNTNR